MGKVLNRPITDASAWKGPEMAKRDDWIEPLNSAEIDEIHGAVEHAKKADVQLYNFSKDSFPLPTLGPRIANIIDQEVENGRGFSVLRGVPVKEYEHDYDTLKVLYWGLAQHIGTPISQNARGDLICEVTDKGLDNTKANARGYISNSATSWHCDSCDVVALFCVHPARKGGESQLASSITIFNTILEEKPEFLPPLFGGFHYDLWGEGSTADLYELTHNRIPVFSYHEGRMSCRYNAKSILRAAIKTGDPLSDLEEAALEYVRDLAARDDIRFDMDFSQGDIQLNNNHMVLHNRTAFEDWDDDHKHRRLYRLWMNIPNGRPLAPEFAD
ncbi:MAG TPA: hypothetical protein DCS82_03305, partial [Rhodospirillaceae bacterium]|nr:hypothetical protein [Rhodospirillaceae bacterium]